MYKIKSINPTNYEVLGEVEVSTLEEVKQKVDLAKTAQPAWQGLGLTARIALLRKTFEEFKKQKEKLASLESREMGKLLEDALAGFDGTLNYALWNFDHAERYLSPETTFENDEEIHQVFYEPVGVVAVIIAWNFPFGNLVWAVLQSLIAGNTIVLKHSEECILCSQFFETIFSHHLPKGVFNVVYGAAEVGESLVNQDIDMIAFTGSSKTGRRLFEVAGQKFIRATMELGGSDPGIIFEDADLAVAINYAAIGRLYNHGQCCNSLKRLMVQESLFEKVAHQMASHFSQLKVGDPQQKTTQLGPLVAKRQLDLLTAQVEDAVAKGAKIICGGHSLEQTLGGAFFEPTILTDITPDMRVWKEEVFGPVLPIIKFKTEQEAIELANQTNYGLGAYLFTQNEPRIMRVSKAIKAGMISVNGINYVKPTNPFGGYKNSGMGREHGRYGFHEVTQVKIIARNKQ